MVWPRHSNPNDFNTELLMRCVCFQILTFAVSATAERVAQLAARRCDLLSNSYLCSICDSEDVCATLRDML